MNLTPEQEAEIRRKVNPIYRDQRGTESYERATLLGEIDRLRAEAAELRQDAESAFTLLATMFDAYEDGDECYEDPEERAGYCGKAIKLGEADFDAIVNLLNKHRPRTAIDAAPSPQEDKP